MRTIPPYIDSGFKNRGERMLFDRLKMLRSESYFAIHSLNLPDHAYKATGEIDFLLLGPRGLYVLEVKGGQVSSHSGVWTYEDRWLNRRTSSEGPFAQAASAMYALRERLKNLVSHSDLNSLVMGYGVVFPDCIFDVSSVEWDPELILDASDWSDRGIENYLHTLEDYWLNKFPDKPRSSDPQRIERLLSALRPEFDLVRSLNVEAMTIEARLVSMTDEQYARLDIIDHCPRILIEGGAGTGKTFLAMETARRHAFAGKRVLLICFSPVLAAFLRKQGSPKVTILSAHRLMIEYVTKFGRLPAGYTPGMPVTDPWFNNSLAPEFERATRNLPDSEKFDVLIIDEGQDILNLPYLTGLENLIRSGLEHGSWRIFYDPFNQGAIFGAVDSDVLEMLRGYGPIPPRLNINCRNTDQIVLQTKLSTGIDMATRSTGPGPEVTINYYDDQRQAAALLEQYLQDLMDQDIDGADITILSPRPAESSTINFLSPAWRRKIRILQGSAEDQFPFPGITFATVPDFKGMENRFIAFVDVEDIDSSDTALAILYVGMTRARVRLWMAINHRLQKHLKDLIRTNFKKIREGSNLG